MSTKISEDDLIDELVRLSEELDKTPTVQEMNDHGEYSRGPYQSRFGTWNDALEAADLTPARVVGVSSRELINSLKALSDELGRTPTGQDMNEHGRHSTSTYRRYFGTWNDALEEAGLKVGKWHEVSKSDLLEELHWLSDELGRTPLGEEMNDMGEYSMSAYRDKFGTWTDALREAGLPPNRKRGVGRDELIDAFQELAEELGETPSAAQLIRHGEYDWKAYRRVFGSWNEAVIAAGFETWTPPTGEDSPHYTPYGQSIYYTLRKFYGDESWRSTRNRILESDEYVCEMQSCDETANEVHHIIPIMGAGCNDDNLLMSLCPRHHRSVEAYTKDEIVDMTIRRLAEEFAEEPADDSAPCETQSSLSLFTGHSA